MKKMTLLVMFPNSMDENILKEMVDSVRPYVSSAIYQVNGPKGSIFETNFEKFKKAFEGIDAVPSFEVWEDFSENRNLLLSRFNDGEDEEQYALFMDADEKLVAIEDSPNEDWDEIKPDAVYVPVKGNLNFKRLIIFKKGRNAYYEGLAHEAIYFMGTPTYHTTGLFEIELRPKKDNKHIYRNYAMLQRGFNRPSASSRLRRRYAFYLLVTSFDLGWYGLVEHYFHFYEKAQTENPFPDEYFIARLYWIRSLITIRMSMGSSSEAKALEEKIQTLFQATNEQFPNRIDLYYWWLRFNIDTENYMENQKVIEHIDNSFQLSYKTLTDHMFFDMDIYKYQLHFWKACAYYRMGKNYLSMALLTAKLFNQREAPEEWIHENYNNMYFYNGFNEMTDTDLMMAVSNIAATGRYKIPIVDNWRFVLEVPYDYDGLGDHALYAALLNAIKERNSKIQIVISDRCKFKTPGTRELLYGYYDSVPEYSRTMPVALLRECNNRRFDMFYIFSLIFGLPEDDMFLKPEDFEVHNVYLINLFEGNSKSLAFNENEKTLIADNYNMLSNHNSETQIPHFEGCNYVNLFLEMETKPNDLKQYMAMVLTSKHFFSVPSGAAIVYALCYKFEAANEPNIVREKPTVFRSNRWKNDKTYILPDTIMKTIWI